MFISFYCRRPHRGYSDFFVMVVELLVFFGGNDRYLAVDGSVKKGSSYRELPSGLSGPEVRRATSGASGCRGGLQRELRSQPLSPCRVPSCRSPVNVIAYSCPPPPTAVPAPVHLRSLAAIASEELARQVQKQLSIKERVIITLLSHCSCQSLLWWFIAVKIFFDFC